MPTPPVNNGGQSRTRMGVGVQVGVQVGIGVRLGGVGRGGVWRCNKRDARDVRQWFPVYSGYGCAGGCGCDSSGGCGCSGGRRQHALLEMEQAMGGCGCEGGRCGHSPLLKIQQTV